MSKFELRQAALERSGISYEESTVATELRPSIYDRLGEKGLRHLSQTFYDKVFADQDKTFRSIFSSSTREEAVENQYLFFVETFGGPALYKAKKGKYTRLVGRHANYRIDQHGAADRWVQHMKAAMQEHDGLKDDPEARTALSKYFLYMAHYIVVASEYMRPDQVCTLFLGKLVFTIES
jgi:truncated hemoglobin YjbI